MSVIRWEDPPPVSSRIPGRPTVADWWTIAAQLRDRPKEWAVVCEGTLSESYPARIRQGIIAAFKPAGSFDAVARNASGVYLLYARYVGEVKS